MTEQKRDVVVMGPAGQATARIATEDDRVAWGIPAGAAVVEIINPGEMATAYPADRVQVHCSAGPDGAAITPPGHPSWCDLDACTAHTRHHHQSTSEIVAADPTHNTLHTTVIEAYLIHSPDYIYRKTELWLEINIGPDDMGNDVDSEYYQLTLHQTRELHEALGRLLAKLANANPSTTHKQARNTHLSARLPVVVV
jgi:hypothetical protein